MLEALFVSTGVVTLAEIGDKTQLLAFLLASRFKKNAPIILGIFLATIVNHGMAGVVGAWIAGLFSPEVLRWVLGVSFIAMALWILIPDKLETEDALLTSKWGVFGVTFIAFFLAEMGDKTQLATVALAASYSETLLVIAGTTLGMLIADVPAVYVGNRMSSKIPGALVRGLAAILFIALGVAALLGAGEGLGL